jgi:hypothetical protein
MKILTSFVTSIFLVVLLLSPACKNVGGVDLSGHVLVDQQYVPADAVPPVPTIPTTIPVRDEKGEPTGRQYVVAKDSTIPAGVPRLPVDRLPSNMEDIEWWASFRTGTPIDPFIPIGVYIFAKFVAARRSRQLVADSIKAATKLDLKGALAGLAKADGWAHSRPAPEQKKPADSADFV